MSLQKYIKQELRKSIENNNFENLKELELLIEKAFDKPNNLVLLGDAYKYSHHKFYLDGMTKMGSYLESRGGRFSETVFFGLQYFLKRYLKGVAITKQDVDEAYEYLGTKLGVFGRDDVFDRSKFDYIVEKHGGRLPVKIKAVPEGTVVGTKNVLLYIENTDPNCAWLTNFLETLILQIWYPITVATLSREVKKIVKSAFDTTTDYNDDTKNFLMEFVLNDFGFRGVSSVQSAKIGGAAHLVNFRGSDTTVASKLIKENYNTTTVYGQSVPATEHSIMCLEGIEGEINMMKRVLEKYPTGIVACVSDTYDILNAVDNYWGDKLKAEILSRPNEPGNQLVIRPDSGHVINTLKLVFKSLFNNFGYTRNSKGFKVLPPQIRVIQGDGVNIDSIKEIYNFLIEERISAENIVFGMGGKLLQAEIDRDTQNFATKACYAIINGEERNVVKSPTEIDENFNQVKSFKKSKQGIPKLVKTQTGFKTITSIEEDFEKYEDELVEVFNNGVITKEWTFEEIRERAKVTKTDLIFETKLDYLKTKESQERAISITKFL